MKEPEEMFNYKEMSLETKAKIIHTHSTWEYSCILKYYVQKQKLDNQKVGRSRQGKNRFICLNYSVERELFVDAMDH